MTTEELIATLDDVDDQAGFGTDFLRLEDRFSAWECETEEDEGGDT